MMKMFILISVLALLASVSCQTLSYIETAYYNDPNCELEISFQALNVVDYCLRDQDATTGNLKSTSFMNHFSPVNAATDGSYTLKKINFLTTDCTGTGDVGVVIPGKTGVCQPSGSTPGVWKISTYSGANDVYNVGAFGYREAYYTSATGCAAKAQITTEKTYQNNACISMGDYSVSYSCMPNGIAGAVTTKTYSDAQCNSLTSVVTQPLPLECSKGINVGSNEQNYMYQSCVDQALPTGYILTNSFATSDCSAAPFMKAYHSVGNCYQKFNSVSDTVIGSYLTVYAPSATSASFQQKMFNFDDGRCTVNPVKSVVIPFATTCTSPSPTSSSISSYMDGTSITRDHALPLVISYYPTAPDCTRATGPSTEYHFAPNTCIKKSGASVQYSYNNGKFTMTTYSDDKCAVGATPVVMTDTTCLSHAGEHNNSEQLFESLTYIAAPAPPPSSTASKGVTATTLEIVFGTICGVLLLVLIYQYYLLQQRKLAMSAAEDGLSNKTGAETGNAI